MVWYEHATELAQHYHNDLPSPDMELLGWEARWDIDDEDGNIPIEPKQTLQQCDMAYFPNIYCLLKIVCIMSYSCERSISGLKDSRHI